jgi:hypothetical protein
MLAGFRTSLAEASIPVSRWRKCTTWKRGEDFKLIRGIFSNYSFYFKKVV